MPKEVLDDIGGSEFADEFKSDSKSDDNNNNDGAKPTKLEGSELVRQKFCKQSVKNNYDVIFKEIF